MYRCPHVTDVQVNQISSVAGPDLNLACRKCAAWLSRIADKANPLGVYATGQLPNVAEAEFTLAIRSLMQVPGSPASETRFRMP